MESQGSLCEQEFLLRAKPKLCHGNAGGNHHDPTWRGPTLSNSGVPSSTEALNGIIVAFSVGHSLAHWPASPDH